MNCVFCLCFSSQQIIHESFIAILEPNTLVTKIGNSTWLVPRSEMEQRRDLIFTSSGILLLLRSTAGGGRSIILISGVRIILTFFFFFL